MDQLTGRVQTVAPVSGEWTREQGLAQVRVTERQMAFLRGKKPPKKRPISGKDLRNMGSRQTACGQGGWDRLEGEGGRL